MSEERLKRTAIHESAHAIFLMQQPGASVRKVELGNNGDGTTYCKSPITKVIHKIDYNSKEARDCVTSLLVGICADLYFQCRISSTKQNDDSAGDDIEDARRMMKTLGLKEPAGYTANDFFRDHSQRAKLWVLANFSKIEALANVLLEKREMTGEEIKRFLKGD